MLELWQTFCKSLYEEIIYLCECTGRMSLWDINLLCIYCRQAVFGTEALQSYPDHFYNLQSKATEGTFTFVASLKTDISKSFYDIPLRPTITPLRCVLYPAYLGKSSYNTVIEIRDANTDEVYVKNTNQMVLVSKETRKTTPLPQWFKDRFDNAIKGSSLIVPRFSLPSAEIPRHICNLRVLYSDIDAYKHANFSSYLKYAIEAAMEAANKGIYKGLFSGVLMNFKVKTVQTAYVEDVGAEQQLAVTTWQNPENLQQVFCDIALKDTQKTVNQVTIDFYEDWWDIDWLIDLLMF